MNDILSISLNILPIFKFTMVHFKGKCRAYFFKTFPILRKINVKMPKHGQRTLQCLEDPIFILRAGYLTAVQFPCKLCLSQGHLLITVPLAVGGKTKYHKVMQLSCFKIDHGKCAENP